MRRSTLLRGIALASAAVLALSAAACGKSQEADGGGGDDKKITIGYVSWDEAIAASNLWENILEEKGYDVELKNIEPGLLYQGLADGNVDFFLDGWLPQTHADYWATFGDKLEKVGVWYDNAALSIAVPEYVDATSLKDLAGKADQFNGEIIGIEPGAGLTTATKEKVMPTYGLDGAFKLKTSTTTAMLAALDGAIAKQEPIVVTLWHPHWAYAKYQLKDLEDPEGTLGTAEEVTTIARKGFGADQPEITAMLQKFTMDDAQLGSLEDLTLNKYKDDPAKGVEEWLAANPDFVGGLG
ncbi:MAG TPA: glycine betaine ABC transporter substrate-binding protein [Phytomonospora sp.]